MGQRDWNASTRPGIGVDRARPTTTVAPTRAIGSAIQLPEGHRHAAIAPPDAGEERVDLQAPLARVDQAATRIAMRVGRGGRATMANRLATRIGDPPHRHRTVPPTRGQAL